MLKFAVVMITSGVLAATSAHAACVKPEPIVLLGMDIAGSPIVVTQPFSVKAVNFSGRRCLGGDLMMASCSS